jgi:sucrose-6-phosphate hydrolase SacC (GH32 family)
MRGGAGKMPALQKITRGEKGHAVRAVFIAMLAISAFAASPYTEKYRPQYHFSPRQGWTGDPDGCIRYRDLYHLFWWGHAVSSDLVRWKERPWPMTGDDNSFMYYTGSVVVDERNTGGWGAEGAPAMVAVYTAHARAGGLENQRLSISTNYTTFRHYEGNPVLAIGSRSFRDPDVFWHEETGRWIMVVAMPDDRQFRFYASRDLKAWELLSSFGPYGARDGLWEVPVLF